KTFERLMDEESKEWARELQKSSDLEKLSPVVALNCLFEADDLLTISRPNAKGEHPHPQTKKVKEFIPIELTAKSHICPNPKSKKLASTPSGHGKDNVLRRKYLIIEGDKTPPERQW